MGELTLRQFVRRRTGVPLGHRDSLHNMLRRSLGSASYAEFWRYWNPLWGYYLLMYGYRPLRRHLPDAPATLLTFMGSGALHDVAVGLLAGRWLLLCTVWFALMGGWVIASQRLRLRYSHLSLGSRAILNVMPTALALALVVSLRGYV